MEKNKLEIFEELKAILKETTNSATSTYGCNNPRKITDKDMEVFKRAFLVYQELYSEYLKKAENRIKDRRLMHELSYLLGQFATNEVQMLKDYANRFKAKKELIIKEPLKLLETFKKAIDEDYILRKAELVSSNGKHKNAIYFLGDASILNANMEDVMNEGKLKILIHKLQNDNHSYVFYSDNHYVNFWPFFRQHLEGKENVWYEQKEDELGKVIENFLNLASRNGYDIDDISKDTMASIIKVHNPLLEPTEFKLKYFLDGERKNLINDLLRAFLKNDYQIIDIVNKETEETYYDTFDLKLFATNSLLRVSKVTSAYGTKYFGSYKMSLESGDLYHKSVEYNEELENPSFGDLENALGNVLNFSKEGLVPSLIVLSKSKVVTLEKDGLTYILTIDNVRYKNGNNIYDEEMVLVEVKSLDGHKLNDIHDFLNRDIEGLALTKESKYQRGIKIIKKRDQALNLVLKKE